MIGVGTLPDLTSAPYLSVTTVRRSLSDSLYFVSFSVYVDVRMAIWVHQVLYLIYASLPSYHRYLNVPIMYWSLSSGLLGTLLINFNGAAPLSAFLCHLLASY